MQPEPKISEAEFLLLFLAALAFDAVTWIPFLGTAINFFATGFFSFYFWLKGVKKFGGKIALGGLLGFLPLPAKTAMMVRVYMGEKAQEKLGLEKVTNVVKA